MFNVLNDLFYHMLSEGTHLSLFLHVIRREATHTQNGVPHGGQYDLVEQALVELFSHFEAGPLHNNGGGQTQDDTEATEHAEHR